jgi:hypothetical protein
MAAKLNDEPEACAKCGSGWVTGKPSSFKRSLRHKQEMLYLCPKCRLEIYAKINCGAAFGGNSAAMTSPYVQTGQFGK